MGKKVVTLGEIMLRLSPLEIPALSSRTLLMWYMVEVRLTWR